MSTKQIASHFSEAAEILLKFNNSANMELIEKAGQILVESLKNVGTQIYQRIEESNLSLKIRVVNPEDLFGLGTFSWNRNYLFRIRIRAK